MDNHLNKYIISDEKEAGYLLIKTYLIIKNVSTNIIKIINITLPLYNGDDEPSIFAYSDGNYSCDCNRSILYTGVFDEYDCGDSAYKICIINPKNGGILYQEFI